MTLKYYFPSCKFTQLRPETSEKVKRFMDSKGVRVVGCCRPGHKALSGWNDIRIFCSRIIKGSVSHCRTVTGPKRKKRKRRRCAVCSAK